MTAWLARAGAAPLALGPVLLGCAYGPRARNATVRRESAALLNARPQQNLVRSTNGSLG